MTKNYIPQFGSKTEGEYKDRLSAYVLVLNEEKKLLVVRIRDKYHLPGGGIESGESPMMAVIRETQEESGCEIKNLSCVGKANEFFIRSNGDLVNKIAIFYRADLINIDLSKKIEEDHEVDWLDIDDFIQLLSYEFHRWAAKRIREI